MAGYHDCLVIGLCLKLLEALYSSTSSSVKRYNHLYFSDLIKTSSLTLLNRIINNILNTALEIRSGGVHLLLQDFECQFHYGTVQQYTTYPKFSFS